MKKTLGTYIAAMFSLVCTILTIVGWLPADLKIVQAGVMTILAYVILADD